MSHAEQGRAGSFAATSLSGAAMSQICGRLGRKDRDDQARPDGDFWLQMEISNFALALSFIEAMVLFKNDKGPVFSPAP